SGPFAPRMIQRRMVLRCVRLPPRPGGTKRVASARDSASSPLRFNMVRTSRATVECHGTQVIANDQRKRFSKLGKQNQRKTLCFQRVGGVDRQVAGKSG